MAPPPAAENAGESGADTARRQETIPVNDDPAQLFGLSNVQVQNLLGIPHLLRRDGPAEIWQYRGEDCILDVFIYAAGGGWTVRHVDLRGPGTATRERRACFARMLIDQRAAAG